MSTVRSPRMARRPVTRLPPERRHDEILAAARAVLREVGYERLKMTDVAERCRISEGLVYRYFPTKDDLLERVCEAWFDEILEVEPGIAEVKGTYERLHYVVRWSLSVVRAEPALTRYILTVMRARTDFRSRRLFELNRRITGVVASVLQEAVDAGDFGADIDVRLLRDLVFGALEHQTWAYLRGEGDFDVDETARGITTVIYRGMATGPARRSCS